MSECRWKLDWSQAEFLAENTAARREFAYWAALTACPEARADEGNRARAILEEYRASRKPSGGQVSAIAPPPVAFRHTPDARFNRLTPRERELVSIRLGIVPVLSELGGRKAVEVAPAQCQSQGVRAELRLAVGGVPLKTWKRVADPSPVKGHWVEEHWGKRFYPAARGGELRPPEVPDWLWKGTLTPPLEGAEEDEKPKRDPRTKLEGPKATGGDVLLLEQILKEVGEVGRSVEAKRKPGRPKKEGSTGGGTRTIVTLEEILAL